jgi:hypothetical protein
LAVKRNERLKTIGDVSHFLAKIINQVVRDEVSESKAAKLGYLSNILIGIIRDYELEERVKKLEDSLSSKTH